MPEGPEIYQASRFINTTCKGLVFGGSVTKSATYKSPQIDWNKQEYSISASSWGKELKLTLTEISKAAKPETLDIVVRFGLVGRIAFEAVEDIHKHAHLNFFTKDKKNALSFVDPMRFGSWNLSGNWANDRGPCVINDYKKFRENVLNNLKKVAFNKPICEALINQKFFNGIGNYLRAEILYRAEIRPFEMARDVLETLNPTSDPKNPDLLELCHLLPLEVINLSEKSGYGATDDTEEGSAYSEWLRCYTKPNMNNLVDHNNRTIWFDGDAGPMAPKNAVERHEKGSQRKRTSKAAFSAGSKNAKKDDKVTEMETEIEKDTESRGKSRKAATSGKNDDEASVEDPPRSKRQRRGAGSTKDDLDEHPGANTSPQNKQGGQRKSTATRRKRTK